MGLVNMFTWWQWLLMASIPPLILMLYFLKLRRMPLEVPSTYLWRKTIEDLHVNSIWQRLRNNLLLWLQLLAILAIILACLRPGRRGTDTIGARSIFLIDNSCSMQATDVDNSRLAKAKKEALRMVDALGRSDVGMVIAFSDRADVRQGFTNDKKKLRSAINGIGATNRITDPNEALRAASGLANPGRASFGDVLDVQVADAMPATLYILSDGRFNAPQLDLGNLAAEYIPIGEVEPRNVGIVAFTADRNTEKPDEIQAFALVQNFGTQLEVFSASLMLDDELIDAQEVEVEAGASTGVSFEILNLVEGRLELALDIDDDLTLDNQAFAGLDPPRQLEVVLATAGNSALEAAFSTKQAQSVASVRTISPDSLSSPDIQVLAENGTVDLFIYDNCAPESMPEANTMFIGSMPPGEIWKAGETTGPHFVIDINRTHPMMQYVDLGTIQIVDGRALELPPAGTELVRSNEGVLFGVAPRKAYQDAVLSMPLLTQNDVGVTPNTDWIRKRSFPVFFLNALEYLGGAVSTSGSRTVRPGEPANLSLASRYESVEILLPSGSKSNLDRAGGTNLVYTETEEPGFYQAVVPETDQLLQMFTVNLFSAAESNLSISPDLQIGAEQVAANKNQKDIVRVEYWRWLLALALVVLAVEWYVYNRRIAI